jgi:hypothetical protein
MRLAVLAAACAALMALAAADFPKPADLPAKADLPDPLVQQSGERVLTKDDWFKKRRPELKELFQHYMYGSAPPAPDKIDAKIEREDKNYFGGKATLREITIHFGPEGTPPIHLLLVIPNKRTQPAPVFVGMNFNGNHRLLNDPKIALPTVWVNGKEPEVKDNRATEAGRGKDIDVWLLEQTIDRGYAVATFYCGDVDPDRKDKREGVQLHYPNTFDWGTIRAWAWGISRAVDYLVTDKDLDKTKIAVVGHSRLGKTALVAAAFDDRIALAIPLQAGCGGTSPSRGKVGESVKQINTNFPHWFNANFKEFNDHPEKLPFDQHCLIALCAPRPVLLANAEEDLHANPKGQFDMLVAAAPVYRLVDAGGLDAKEMPPNNKLVDSKLGYFIRPGKHSMKGEDWKVFCDFADKWLR